MSLSTWRYFRYRQREDGKTPTAIIIPSLRKEWVQWHIDVWRHRLEADGLVLEAEYEDSLREYHHLYSYVPTTFVRPSIYFTRYMKGLLESGDEDSTLHYLSTGFQAHPWSKKDAMAMAKAFIYVVRKEGDDWKRVMRMMANRYNCIKKSEGWWEVMEEEEELPFLLESLVRERDVKGWIVGVV